MSKSIRDLTGERFGPLTVLGALPERRNGHVVWLCRCECGNVKQVQSPNLKSAKKCRCKWRAAARECAGALKAAEKNKRRQPLRGDCVSYDSQRGECMALTELLCVTRGACSFFTPGQRP